jgi:predicted proteasome-type protease
MAMTFDREALLDAFDEIGRAAVAAGTKLQIAVYGGSALMLASNFRFATEDVHIAEIGGDWPNWLREVTARIATRNDWSPDWLNDAVSFHLSDSPSATETSLHSAASHEKARRSVSVS